MAIALYMDHHVPRAITVGLRVRGVAALTAEEDGARKGSRILPSWIGRRPWDGRFLRTMMIS